MARAKRPTIGGHNVFVSWSKPRSKGPAKAFADWLDVVVQAAKPWISTDDIPSGSAWFSEITTTLEACNFGVVFVTRENMREPWIYFEAGAILKAVSKKARVCPVVLDFAVTDLEDPFASLNVIKPDKEGMLKLVLDINRAIGSDVGDDKVRAAFEGQWHTLEPALRVSASKTPQQEHRSERALLNEILVRVRSLQQTAREDAREDYEDARAALMYASANDEIKRLLEHDRQIQARRRAAKVRSVRLPGARGKVG